MTDLSVPGSKPCRVCTAVKPFEDYYRTATGTRNECKACVIARTSKRYFKHKKDELELRHWRRVQKVYGIDRDEYLRMYRKQLGLCAICEADLKSTKRRPHIDHCHTTGKVRGILCNDCNVGIGLFRDNPIRLEQAARYVREHA